MRRAEHVPASRWKGHGFGTALLMACVFGAVTPAARAHPMRLGVLRIMEREGAPASARLRYSGTEDRPTGVEIAWPRHCRARELTRLVEGTTGRTRQFSVDCGTRGLGGANLGIRGVPSDVQVLVEVERPGHETFRHVLDAHHPKVAVPGATFDAVLPGTFWLGLDHVASGADHLLFLVALVALVGVGHGSRRRLAWTITSFTAGHALTLCAASADLVRVPTAPVEALIALSIVLLAAELARHGRAAGGWTARAPAVLALPFGLLHGLGFAGVLATAGIPRGSLTEALLGFNIGVEAGQLAIAALVAGAFLALRRAAPFSMEALPRVVGYAVGVPAAAWTLARLAVLGSG